MVCGNGAVARLPSSFQRLSRTTAATLPPAFLAPRVRARSFSLQSSCLATASPTKTSSNNAAQNLRGTLRRLGQSSKWGSKPPASSGDAALRKATATATASPFKRSSSPRKRAATDRPRPSDHRRDQNHGFRLRAKALLDDLHNAIRDRGDPKKTSLASAAQNDAAVAKALFHFENEMKALRVMIKSKDVLVDPDNAWKSASRIKAPYNAAIRLCMQAGKYERAHKLLSQMKKDGIFPNAATYSVVINGLVRCLAMQTHSATSERNSNGLLERKEVQRIREVYQDLENLWKQAFPRYFQRTATPRPKDALILDKDDFHNMTDQARRNLVSQQASIHEAREFPKVLTNAIGAYTSFLRYIDSKEEIDRLFERIFPSCLLDSMAKGLMPNASPQDKLETANRKLSVWLPLGDKTIFSGFLTTVKETEDANRFDMVERTWTRLEQLMDLERYEMLYSSSHVDRKRKTNANNATEGASTNSDEARFVPDDQLMVDLFNRLQAQPDTDPTRELRLGLSILSKVYGLDLESTADNIIRDPQLPGKAQAFEFDHYLRRDSSAIDGLGAPVAELRDPTIASTVFRFLDSAEAWPMSVALFNYLWARGHAENTNAGLEAGTVTTMASDTTVFGNSLRPAFAMRVLWYLARLGDPLGARVLLDAMKRASAVASERRFGMQNGANGRARRAKPDARRSDRTSSALEWQPADICYTRALRANLAAVLKEPQGLTAATLKDAGAASTSSVSSKNVVQDKYDAWTEAKSLFAEWSDFQDAQGSRTRTTRSLHRTEQGFRHDNLSRIHIDTMRSLLLNIAHVYATQQGDQGVEVARDALRILEGRVGLERLVEEGKQLQDDMEHASKEEAALRGRKLYTLGFLSKIINLSLDTSQQSFAPKADVELWKRVKRMLPASSASDDSETRNFSQQRSQEVRGRRTGGSRLLLSKDDYLELESGAEADDEEEAFDQADEGFSPRGGSYRMQRRSRHVEQELERWVRGASV